MSGAAQLTKLADRAKELGCIHHRFAIGDGEILVVDEWENAEAFHAFFADDEIASAMQAAGAQGAPDIAFYEAIETPDQF